jgi:hypothetical protein
LATCGGAFDCVYKRFITTQRHASVMPRHRSHRIVVRNLGDRQLRVLC